MLNNLKILIIIMMIIFLYSCTSNPVKKEVKFQEYIDTIFNNQNKSDYICDIPVILKLNGDCGFIQVPVDYSQENKNTYAIFWFFLPAENKTATTKTIVPLSGGPGLSVSSEITTFIENSNFTSLLKNNNILSFDYRGIGLSEPYDTRAFSFCDGEENIENDILVSMRHCKNVLKKYNIQYSNITTANFVKDLERILIYRNIDKVILYGMSYGTRVALTAARDIPNRVSGMVLDGLFPIEVNGFEQGSEAPLFNLSYLIQNFHENKNLLPSNFYDIEQRITNVASDAIQNNNQDKAMEILSFISRYAYNTYRFAIAHILLDAYEQNKDDVYKLFNKIEEVTYNDNGNTFFDIIDEKSRALFTHRAFGWYMSLSIIASEEYNTPFQSNLSEIKNLDLVVLTLFEKFQGGAPLLKEEVAAVKDMLQFKQANAIEFEAVVSDIPTLLFSARQDMQTSPRWGEMVADNTSNSKHFIFTTEDHVLTFSNTCALLLFEDFVKKPQEVKMLNASCVEEANRESMSIKTNIMK